MRFLILASFWKIPFALSWSASESLLLTTDHKSRDHQSHLPVPTSFHRDHSLHNALPRSSFTTQPVPSTGIFLCNCYLSLHFHPRTLAALPGEVESHIYLFQTRLCIRCLLPLHLTSFTSASSSIDLATVSPNTCALSTKAHWSSWLVTILASLPIPLLSWDSSACGHTQSGGIALCILLG